ncbi:MAG: ABC transporter permease [Lachnospiraceae bacterium]|nr:ABC transporter permease [Lachnospiraceae bacterium]
MRNLLSANFARLWRCRLFWFMEAGVFAWGVLAYYLLKVNTRNGYPFLNGNSYFFNEMTFIGITIACFSGFFIGTEYSDGAMRNKLSVGHSRMKVYLANLVTILCAGFAQLAAYTLAAVTAGTMLVGDMVWNRLYRPAETVAISFLSICTSAAIAVWISMVIIDKSKAVLINAMFSILLLAAGASALKGLMQPEMTQRIYISSIGEYRYAYEDSFSDDGDWVIEEVPNPKYLVGMERKVYEYVSAVLPTSLALSCALNEDDNDFSRFSGLQIFGTLAAVVLISGSGIQIFRKKDLK